MNTVPDILAATYLTYSESRLREAGARCQNAIANGYAANLGELAIAASLTWDGAIDLLSALATLDGEDITGRSSDLRRYARHTLPQADFSHWSRLATLHNFQHKPNHAETVFRSSCHGVGSLLTLLNGRLPAPLQLSSACFNWLAVI